MQFAIKIWIKFERFEKIWKIWENLNAMKFAFLCLLVLSAVEASSDSAEFYDDLPDVAVDPLVKLDFTYHNYSQLTGFLRDVSVHYPHLTHLYSIGKSVAGNERWLAINCSVSGAVFWKQKPIR